MNVWTQRTAKTLMLAAGFVAAGTGLSTAAFASTGPITSGTGSVAGGNQVNIPISVPVDVCGNAAAILGAAVAGCEGGASVAGQGGSPALYTNGAGSVGGGNQVNAPVAVPVAVCGNAVGQAKAHCPGGATVHGTPDAGSMITSGKGSVLGGNQVNAPVSVPVDVCGNSVAVLGVAGADCKGGATVGTGHWATTGHWPTTGQTAPGQCGCATGSAAVTSLLPTLTQKLTSTPLKLTAYVVGGPAALSGHQLTVTQPATGQGTSSSEAGLGTLPLAGGLTSLAGLSSLSGLAATPGAPLLPENDLSAANTGTMSDVSFYTLTGGMLLAGASALMLSGRRARANRSGRKAAA
ncbi:MAG: chaplin family protein [Streptosporangiaceae bacterium]